jgi:hypothetical protein
MPAPKSSSGWKLIRCSSMKDMRREGIRRWQCASADARINAAWEMVQEAWALKKRPPDELRLQRTVAVLRKA